jgi:hypothetical protein
MDRNGILLLVVSRGLSCAPGCSTRVFHEGKHVGWRVYAKLADELAKRIPLLRTQIRAGGCPHPNLTPPPGS